MEKPNTDLNPAPPHTHMSRKIPHDRAGDDDG